MNEPVSSQLAWKTLAGRRCLAVRFPKKLDETTAGELIDRVVAEVEGSPRPVPLIWDCRGMESYTPQAFAAWRRRLPAIASNLDGICCLTDSTFIRMGARALGLALKMNITACTTENDIIWE